MNPWPFVIAAYAWPWRDRGVAAVVLCVDAPRRGRGRHAEAAMKPKSQRLVLVTAAIVAGLVAVLLAMWGMRSRASYFYTPAEIAAGKAEQGRAVRLGGMVERGSVQRSPTASPSASSSPTVRRELRSSIAALSRTCSAKAAASVAEGRIENGTFVADTILAKHDERYMPPELGNLAAEHKAGKTVEK